MTIRQECAFVYFSLDINECLNNTHQCESKVNGGVCINTVGSHDCSCLPGYDGDGWKVINALTKANNASRQGCSGMFGSLWICSLNFERFQNFSANLHNVQSKINLFAGRAVKRERRKGSSRRQQPAYGAAVNEVARELLRSARSPKRENGGRRYIKHDGMIASPVGSCLCC